jgi:hypothetical protein
VHIVFFNTGRISSVLGALCNYYFVVPHKASCLFGLMISLAIRKKDMKLSGLYCPSVKHIVVVQGKEKEEGQVKMSNDSA